MIIDPRSMFMPWKRQISLKQYVALFLLGIMTIIDPMIKFGRSKSRSIQSQACVRTARMRGNSLKYATRKRPTTWRRAEGLTTAHRISEINGISCNKPPLLQIWRKQGGLYIFRGLRPGCQKSMIWKGFERRRPKISPLRGALRVSLHFYALLRSFWALKLVQNKQNLKENKSWNPQKVLSPDLSFNKGAGCCCKKYHWSDASCRDPR